MNTEELFSDIISQFKESASKAVNSAISDLHNEYMPHVGSDMQANVATVTAEVINKIIRGRFIVDDDYIVVENNGYDCRIRIYTVGFFTPLLDSLIKHMPKCPKDIKIQILQEENERLIKFYQR